MLRPDRPRGVTTSKLAGVRRLVRHGLAVPRTIAFASPLTTEDVLAGAAAAIADGNSWVVEIDAPLRLRLSARRTRAAGPELRDVVRRMWLTRATGTGLVLQRQVAHRMCGSAVRTGSGWIVVESQGITPGNFARDGTVPRRWVYPAAGRPDSSLPEPIGGTLAAALGRLDGTYCVEWVLDAQDRVFFVDAKPVPADFLAAVTDTRAGACVPVLAGHDSGVLLGRRTAPHTRATPRIHLVDSTTVAAVPLIGGQSRGIIFRRGGLLSHAVVYAAQQRRPVLVCAESERYTGLDGRWVRLSVAADGHWIQENHTR